MVESARFRVEQLEGGKRGRCLETVVDMPHTVLGVAIVDTAVVDIVVVDTAEVDTHIEIVGEAVAAAVAVGVGAAMEVGFVVAFGAAVVVAVADNFAAVDILVESLVVGTAFVGPAVACRVAVDKGRSADTPDRAVVGTPEQ